MYSVYTENNIDRPAGESAGKQRVNKAFTLTWVAYLLANGERFELIDGEEAAIVA